MCIKSQITIENKYRPYYKKMWFLALIVLKEIIIYYMEFNIGEIGDSVPS